MYHMLKSPNFLIEMQQAHATSSSKFNLILISVAIFYFKLKKKTFSTLYIFNLTLGSSTRSLVTTRLTDKIELGFIVGSYEE